MTHKETETGNGSLNQEVIAPNDSMPELPLRRAADLRSRGAEQRWLIEGLWGAEACGLLGAEPKCCKTWLALDMAVSVATGTPCIGRFAVGDPGHVLYFAAEDGEHIVRERVAGISAKKGVRFEDVHVTFLTPESLFLDDEAGRALLRRAIEKLRPKLVVLDPFVRLHRGAESSAMSVGHVLSYLRGLQRAYQTAVLLVHHMRKSSGRLRPGQALRGSSDLHGFGDCNLYLAREKKQILLTAEQRGAEGFERLVVKLEKGAKESIGLQALHFAEEDEDGEGEGGASPERPRIRDRDLASEVLTLLGATAQPLTQRAIRQELRANTANTNRTLRHLVENGQVVRRPEGYQLVAEAPVESAATPPAEAGRVADLS